MQIKNAKKIVLKLGSTTVVDGKGVFKKVGNFIKDIKKYGKGKTSLLFLQEQSPLPKIS